MLIENILTYEDANSTYYQERVLFSLTSMPDYDSFSNDYTIMIGLPQWLHMAELSMDETAMVSLFIRLKDPDDHAMVDKIANAFKETFGTSSSIEIEKSYE